MDGQRIDAIARAMATTTSRRQFLRGLAGGASAGAALLFAAKEAVAAPRWGDFSHGDCCPASDGRGYRTYSAILWDIPWGQSWEKTCAATPAKFTDIYGVVQYFKSPTRCENNGFNEWGHFNVWDAACDGALRCLTVGTAW